MNEIIYSQIGYSADQWYKIDVLMDWESSFAAFFIDNVLKAETDFFSAERDKAKKADVQFLIALHLYTLSPGETSYFKDIRLCTHLCPST